MNILPRKGNRWDGERSKHNWRAVADAARRSPEEWVLASLEVSTGTVQNVRTGKILPLRDLGGRIEATMRNSHTVGASRYGDLYVRWTPQDVVDAEEKEDA